jgi:hypothetical protein
MNREQYFQALHKLHEPLRRQQIRTNAIAKTKGTGSREYEIEFQKEAAITQAIELPEHTLWTEFTCWLLTQAIQAGTRTKEQALQDIYQLAHDAPESKKPAWREAYKKIRQL